MHAGRILEGLGTGSLFDGNVQSKMDLLFRVAPSSLSEFKPSWGWVFAKYLHGYSHWTYTDTDVIFGRLDNWLGGSDFDGYDIETWSFNGDAGRLFLRGQWTMHKNKEHINLLWRNCSHLGRNLNQNLDYKLKVYSAPGDWRKKQWLKHLHGDQVWGSWDANLAALQMDSLGYSECGGSTSKFVSAEGCYSCVVLSSDVAAALSLKVRISPFILSDHTDWPVWWMRGNLVRCLPHGNSGMDRCRKILNTWLTNEQHSTLHRDALWAASPDATYKHATVIRDCSNMHWICRSAPRAALHAILGPQTPNLTLQPLGRNDAVQIQPMRGFAALPAATVIVALSAKQKKQRPELIEMPIFHYRKWVDYGKWGAVSLNSHDRLPSFVIKKSGFHKYF